MGLNMARLWMDPARLGANVEVAVRLAAERGCNVLPVTKVIQSRPDLLSRVPGGWNWPVADVSVANLKALDRIDTGDKVLLRPRFSDIPGAVIHADRIFLSDPDMARAIARAREACMPGRPLDIMLMVEAGDLRDGIPLDAVSAVLADLSAEPGMRLEGLAVNFGCLAGVLPGEPVLARVAEACRQLRLSSGLKLPVLSLGGTVCWEPLREGLVPPEFNEIRMGEALFFGWNTSRGIPVPEFDPRVFTLDLEVLEIWEKDVPPSSGDGLNAFGESVVQVLTGLRHRAVLEGGENLSPWKHIRCMVQGAVPVGASHEYTVLDCEDARVLPRPGECVSFSPAYEAVTRCFLSPMTEISIREEVS